MTRVVAHVQEVSRRFEPVAGRPPALDHVSLEVRAGEVLAIVGRSGSGKTTLLQMLGALDEPDDGSVWVGDTALKDLRDSERTRLRREEIGFVFQDAQLVPTMSVEENVALTAVIAGKRRDAWTEREMEILTDLGLSHLARARPSRLSGGESQRVALGRALFARPALLLADEPTGALDSATSRSVLTLLRRAVDEAAAVVVVTHDLETACIADRLVVLRDGRIVAESRMTAASCTSEDERRLHEERVRSWLAEHR